MKRRALLVVVTTLLAAKAVPTESQQRSGTAVVGILMPAIGPDHPAMLALRDRLRELGYAEGRNIKYEFRSAQGQMNRLPALADELVRLKVDVIVAATEPAIRAVKNATTRIPVVMVVYSSDPADARLVKSFDRPGGNLTGIFTLDSELQGKRLELLKDAIPGLTRVAVFREPFSTQHESEELERAARSLKIQLDFIEFSAPYDVSAAVAAAKRKNVQAAMNLMAPALVAHSGQIAQQALAYRLPLMAFPHDFTRAGGLMSYGTELRDNYYRAAYFVDKLLKGAQPSDLGRATGNAQAARQSEDGQGARHRHARICADPCR
jgi:putative ABC transport system substrate-binding protein